MDKSVTTKMHKEKIVHLLIVSLNDFNSLIKNTDWIYELENKTQLC